MTKHDYTAKDSLALLIKKIESASPDLAKRIRLAIDAGKDVQIEENIMRAEIAKECRRHPNDPPASSAFGAWECKFYDTPLDKHLARAFVGLVDDLGTNLRLAGFCSNQTHAQMRSYFQPQRRPYPHLLLTPRDPPSETRFVGVLSAELKKMTEA